MLEKQKMNRINELARAAKERPLSESELEEQAALRLEYLEAFRSSFKNQLENITIVDDDEEVILIDDDEDEESLLN